MLGGSAKLDFNALAKQIEESAKDSARIVVGIDGPGASGKSTFAKRLASSMSGAHIVHVDNFFLPEAQRNIRLSQVGQLFDIPRLARQVIEPSSKTAPFQYQRYDWTRDELTEWIDVPESAPVLVEGVYSLIEELRAAYTYKVWCRADPAIRLARGLARDGEQARSLWLDIWMPAEDEYAIIQTPERAADLIVESSPINDEHHAFWTRTSG